MTRKEIVRESLRAHPITKEWKEQVRVAAQSGGWGTSIAIDRDDVDTIYVMEQWIRYYGFDYEAKRMPQQHYVRYEISWNYNLN